MFEIVPLINDHLDFARKVAEKNKKTYIHEVDPLTMLNAFEQAKKLHPAMPGYKEMMALKSLDNHIQQLEEQLRIFKRAGVNEKWWLKVDRFKDTSISKMQGGIESYLNSAKMDRAQLQQAMETKMKANFYNDFSKYLMGLAGLKGPGDLLGGESFWNFFKMTKVEAWQKFNEFAPTLLIEGASIAFAPQQLNSYMANIFKALNENLKKMQAESSRTSLPAEAAGASDPKIKEMEVRCRRLIEQLKKVLPRGIVQELTEIPLIHRIPGKLLAEALREALRQYPLSKLLEMGIVAAVERLPEKLPKDAEEFKLSLKRRAEENESDIQTICEEGEKSFPLLIEKIEHNLFAWWNKKQAELDDWIRRISPGGAKVKEFFDKIFHMVFISYIMGYTYRFTRWLLFFAMRLTSNLVADNVNTGRKSLVDTPINANLLYQIGDKFKKIYA